MLFLVVLSLLKSDKKRREALKSCCRTAHNNDLRLFYIIWCRHIYLFVNGNINCEVYWSSWRQSMACHYQVFQNGHLIFQDGDAPCQASRTTKVFQEEIQLLCFPWAAQSPDINGLVSYDQIISWETFQT